MAFPANPLNNQTVTVNGVLYTYNSTKGVWSVTTNSGVDYNVNSVNASALVTAGNIKTTSGVFWANGAVYSPPAGGSTNGLQYNSSGTFAGATDFTYTAQTGNVVIGATTATSSATTGALVVGGGIGISGNIYLDRTMTFTAANPTISSSSYITIPGGAFFNSGTVYFGGTLASRSQIINDTGTKIVTIGSASQLSVANTMTSTSATTGALVVTGGIGVAGTGVFGGNVTIGNMTQTRANLLVYGGNLNATTGSILPLAEFYATNTNGSYLRITKNRNAQGADWTSASTKIQQRIDVTDQGYIEFNPLGSTYGIDIGNATTAYLRVFTGGNIIVTATTASTTTTTGALVVKGGMGVAGQITTGGNVTAANVVITTGIIYANGAAYSSGSGAGTAVGNSSIITNNQNITANATLSAGTNGFSVGPVNTANGITVTVSNGQRWVII